MTCDWGELRLEVEKGPTIKEIKITPADTPMTENNVEIEAVVEEVPGYEVVSANFALTDVKKGTVDLVKAVVKNTAPYSFTFKSAAGTHGKKKIACTLTYKNTTTNLTGTDQAEKEFNLFFKRDARTDPTNASSEPNWFKYWRIDGAVPGFDATILYAPVCDPGSTCYGAYDPGTGLISFGPEASGTHYWQAIVLTTFFGNESFGGPTVKGIDCAAEVIAHEGKHKEVKENWDSGVFTEPDSDKVTDNSCIYTHPTDGWHRHCDDRLPDNYEINTSHTLNNTTDTYDLEHEKFGVYKTYGDQ
jgi:copper chaperone CopZ